MARREPQDSTLPTSSDVDGCGKSGPADRRQVLDLKNSRKLGQLKTMSNSSQVGALVLPKRMSAPAGI
jgi:hypothetical protein